MPYTTDNSHVGTDTLKAKHLIVQGLLISEQLFGEGAADIFTVDTRCLPISPETETQTEARKSLRKEQATKHLSSMFRALGSSSSPGGINKTTATKPTRVS